MTVKQRMLRLFYPILMTAGKFFGVKAGVLQNKERVKPPHSFYDLSIEANDGRRLYFKDFAGKNILLVNTASGCGYTNQFEDLEKMYRQYPDLEVIGFPSNDFKEQEQLSDQEISNFCKVNFGVTFPLAKKSIVTKSDQQNEVFSWLSHSEKNGWNNVAPEWNFSKYLVNKSGVLVSYFGPAIEPLSDNVRSNLQQ